MINWYYLLVVACLLAAFLLYKEWTRNKKSFLYGRLLASLLAVGSLLFMAYPVAEDAAAEKKIVLLTSGFVRDSVTTFLKNNKGALIFSTIHAPDDDNNKIQLVTDLAAFAAQHAATVLDVFGNGCSREELALLQHHPIVFHATPAVPAINHIYWKKDLEPGEPLVIQGSYDNNSRQKIKIAVTSFGVSGEPVFIDPGAKQDFELRGIPVHAGKAVYTLVVTAATDTLQKEPIPVAVQNSLPLQLLIISSAPDFDNTYLKNKLSQQGYQVTMFTAVSSNKTNKQFLNTPLQPASARLSTAYLGKFDVLMADEEALQKVSAFEQTAIRTAVQENGTGLIIKLDAERRQAFYSRFFPVKELEKNRESFTRLHSTITDSNRYKIKITDPAGIVYTPGTQMILQDDRANNYAATVLYGSGKIIATTLQNTYSMALAGDKTSYQQLWRTLLNKAAKKIYQEESWRTHPFIAMVNEPVAMQTEKADLANRTATTSDASIYLTQDALLPFLWNGLYWPVAAGWQDLPRINTTTGGWYVCKTGDWQSLIDYQHLAATKQYAAAQPFAAMEPVHAVKGLPVNWQLYLWLVFLGAFIFLWVEQKA